MIRNITMYVYSSLNIIRRVKSRYMSLAGRVACTEERINAHNIFVGKSEDLVVVSK
jgi:hypothetical protein